MNDVCYRGSIEHLYLRAKYGQYFMQASNFVEISKSIINVVFVIYGRYIKYALI
jgi:hypothetical protein